MMAVAGLDAGVITSTSRVRPGFFPAAQRAAQVPQLNRSGDGWVDLDLAIARSNDTYFYDMAHKLGVDRMYDYMTRFGLGQRVSLTCTRKPPG